MPHLPMMTATISGPDIPERWGEDGLQVAAVAEAEVDSQVPPLHRTDCGSGSVCTPPQAGGARGRGAVHYPDGVPDLQQYVINEYNTVGNRIKPPSVDREVRLERAEDQTAHRLGDDPALAAPGSPAPARRDFSTDSSSPNPASSSSPVATIKFAPGTATRGNSSGPRASTATLSALR